jgi:acyl-CoA thioesterase
LGLDDDTALRGDGSGEYRGHIDGRWWTPRGPLGGFVMAVVMRALLEAVDDPARQPRALTVHFLRAPEAGPVTVRAHVERSGRSLTNVSGRLEQGGATLALALGAFARPWPGPFLTEAPIPDVPPPRARSVPPRELPQGGRPPFTDLVTMEPRFGSKPFSGADRAETGGWLGLFEEREVDALTVLVLADAWYPAPWPRLRALAPAPTTDMTVHFRAPLPLPDSLLLGRFRSRLIRDGFVEEDGELWAPDGTLVAQSRQLGLLIGAQA